MIRYISLQITFILTLNAVAYPGYSQGSNIGGTRVMFYNVENLFDIYDDSVKDDNDFLPEGVMRWNYSRYKRKINSLYKTITAVGEWDSPGIVALCEVENRDVIEDLIYNTYLSKNNYGIIHEDSPDLRGIDVCLIFRKDKADVLDSRYLIPADFNKDKYRTRSVLYAKFLIRSDTLHLFVNHWPSRRGGVLAGEAMRGEIAAMVGQMCDSILRSSNANAKIIVTGDFNCTPDDVEIKSLTNHERDTLLYNLSEKAAERGEGTYRYRGIWEMIDQVMVSENLLKSENGLFTTPEMVKIFNPGFLLENDPLYPGASPFATYRGYRYHGGFSDHLPVFIDLIIK